MAAPIDSSRTTSQTIAAGTSHTINLGSPAAGTLLIVFIRVGNITGALTFTGYTNIVDDQTDATDDRTLIYYRWADGTEGATATFVTTNTSKLSAITWQITGAENPATSAPTVSTVAVGTTTANTCDPGSVAPAGAPQDTLYLACGGCDGEVGAFTAAPTNYTNLVAANSSTAGQPATNTLQGGASRQITASSSDDPGVFTHAAATTGWTAFTVAIRAAASTAGSSIQTMRQRRANRFLTSR